MTGKMKNISKKVVIFGIGDLARVAKFYFRHDSDLEVVAFALDREYIKEDSFDGLAVVAFEEVEKHYPPSDFSMYVGIGYSNFNQNREEKYFAAKEKGYSFITYVNSKTTQWGDTEIGENTFILEDVTIQPFVKIGNNCVIWSGNHIGHDSHIADHCFLTSHVVISGNCRIGKNCFLGVNATIRDGIKVADKCIIGAGTLILKDTETGSVYKGTATEPKKS